MALSSGRRGPSLACGCFANGHPERKTPAILTMEDHTRETGRVRWFKAEKGYGRIRSDEGGDLLFVHFSSIAQDGFRALAPGQPVEYTRTVQPGPRGPRAAAVQVTVMSMGRADDS